MSYQSSHRSQGGNRGNNQRTVLPLHRVVANRIGIMALPELRVKVGFRVHHQPVVEVILVASDRGLHLIELLPRPTSGDMAPIRHMDTMVAHTTRLFIITGSMVKMSMITTFLFTIVFSS